MDASHQTMQNNIRAMDASHQTMQNYIREMKNHSPSIVIDDDAKYSGPIESGPFLVPYHKIELLGGTYEIIDCLATSQKAYLEEYSFILNGFSFQMTSKTMIKCFDRGDVIRGNNGCKIAYIRRISDEKLKDDGGIISKGMKTPDTLPSEANSCVGYWNLSNKTGRIRYVGKDQLYDTPWDGRMTDTDGYIYDLIKERI